jgi:TPR repeat protein
MTAVRDLALNLFDGIQDRRGHCIVRRNSSYAVRLLQQAAKDGGSSAATMLGYAYDVGRGIRRLAIKWYRRAIRQGDATAASNLATVYRDLGNFKLFHQWYLRAAKMGDGDAAVDSGYDYLYGIGAQKNLPAAKRMFRLAIRSKYISESGREEALYHLAVAAVDNGGSRRAIPLLRRANKDDDYPEAASLLGQIRAKTDVTPCRCRRDLNKHLPGHAKCPQHPIAGHSSVNFLPLRPNRGRNDTHAR